jgi:hypothetical protein
VVALSGCGGSSGGSSGPGLTSGQRQALIQQLEAVRGAAAARDVSGAQDALDRFRRSVLHLRRTGALDAAQARALRIGVARVLARVKSDNPPKPVPAPVVTQTTPAPAPLPPGKAKKHEHGKKHGKHDHSDEGGD